MLSPTNTATIDGLKIQGNTIHVLPFSSGGKDGRADGCRNRAVACGQRCRGVGPRRLRQHVKASLSAGLRLAVNVRRGKISRNRFVDPGSSTETAMASFYRCGITIVGTQVDLIVENNETFDTRSSHLIAQGVMTSMTAVTRSSSGSSSVACTDGASVPNFVQTAGKQFRTSPEAPVAPRFKAGLYYGPEGARSVATTSAGTLTAVPFLIQLSRRSTELEPKSLSPVPPHLWSGWGSMLTTAAAYPVPWCSRPARSPVTQRGEGDQDLQDALRGPVLALLGLRTTGTPQVRAVTNNILGGAGVSTLAVATGVFTEARLLHGWCLGRAATDMGDVGPTATPGVVVLRAA